MAVGSLPLRGIRVRRRANAAEPAYDPRAERLADRLFLIGFALFLVIATGVGMLALQAAGLDWPR